MTYWYISSFTESEAAVFNLPGQGTAFVSASLAFVTAIIIAFVVSMFTTPKPDSELVGFVYSETPKDIRTDVLEASMPWYRRTVPLGVLCMVLVIALNIIFA